MFILYIQETHKMIISDDTDLIFAVIAAISSCLLIISELLGISKCKANSIIQLYKNFHHGCGVNHDENDPRCSDECIQRRQ